MPIIVVVIALLIVFAALAFYFFNQQSKTIKPAAKTPAQPQTATEFVKGQVLSFTNKTLTVKNESGQEVQVKMASQATVLKQKWFDASSMGTVPAEVKSGDNVSVQTLKNNLGEIEVISVVILANDQDKSGKKK